MVYHSVPSRDPAEDSDDPLALSPPYPRNKVRDTVGKQSSQPIISSDNKKAASGQAQRLKTRLQDTTRIVDRKAPLEEKVIEAEKEERALEKRLKVLRKEARRRRTS